MSDLSASSSGSGKSSSTTNLFQRECKAAYLMVKIDTTNDLLSVEELIQAMQHAGRNPTRRIVRKYWLPDTERISFHCFCEILKEQPETTDAELRKAFKKIDHNQNGYISFEELKILKQTDDSLTDEELQDIFSGADKNGDGKIDYNEFVKMVQETAEETKKLALAKLERIERKQLKVKKHNRRERNKEHQNSTEKLVSKLNGIIVKKPVSSAKIYHENDGLHNWSKIKRKGCFIYDDEPTFPTLLSHQYKIIVKKNVEIFLKIRHNTNEPKTFSDDTFMFLMNQNEQIVAFTNERTSDSVYCLHCSLNEGQYFLIPFTTGCKFIPKKIDTNKNRAVLIESGKDGKMKLTKPFRLALMNIFDLCDLDDSGTLSRDEFNIYNIRTGDENVTDDEWTIVTTNFDTKNKELTIKGFVDLHQMEAEDSGGDTDDMWVSLLAMGFNHTLLMEQVLPFVFEIYSTSDIEIKNLEIQSTSQELKNEILTYFERNATDFNSNQKQIRCYQNGFMAALLFHNQESINTQYEISFDGSANISLSYGASNVTEVNVESNQIKLISYILPSDSEKEWIIKATINEK